MKRVYTHNETLEDNADDFFEAVDEIVEKYGGLPREVEIMVIAFNLVVMIAAHCQGTYRDTKERDSDEDSFAERMLNDPDVQAAIDEAADEGAS